MWDHMMGQGYMMDGFGMGSMIILWVAVVVWFVLFTVKVVNKLDKIIELLGEQKKK